jgi:hypothetical protein
MIERLLEAPQPPGRATRIDQRIPGWLDELSRVEVFSCGEYPRRTRGGISLHIHL